MPEILHAESGEVTILHGLSSSSLALFLSLLGILQQCRQTARVILGPKRSTVMFCNLPLPLPLGLHSYSKPINRIRPLRIC